MLPALCQKYWQNLFGTNFSGMFLGTLMRKTAVTITLILVILATSCFAAKCLLSIGHFISKEVTVIIHLCCTSGFGVVKNVGLCKNLTRQSRDIHPPP
jgi:hypothetical protein